MWKIHNAGQYPVMNLKLQIIRFIGHSEGWEVNSGPNWSKSLADTLAEGAEQTLDICEYICKLGSIYPEMKVIHPGYVLAVLSFDRRIDGKRYLLLEPFLIDGGSGQLYPMSVATFGGDSGILRRCSGRVEL